MNWLYLEDGTYIAYDGFSIHLRTGSIIEPTNEIIIHPATLLAINAFYEVRRKEAKDADSAT